MKQILVLLVVIGSLACAVSDAGLHIESLDRNGELTWTNWATNATYRVEWAGSLTGPWTNFDALSNLSSIAASDTTVTVTVPMFYRVVWTDPPSPPSLVGDWLFIGYDDSRCLVATGLVRSVPSANVCAG